VFPIGAKILGRETLRTGGKILTDIAENPQTKTRDFVSKHVSESAQNSIKGCAVVVGDVRERELLFALPTVKEPRLATLAELEVL
jgi:hypothetical protein